MATSARALKRELSQAQKDMHNWAVAAHERDTEINRLRGELIEARTMIVRMHQANAQLSAALDAEKAYVTVLQAGASMTLQRQLHATAGTG